MVLKRSGASSNVQVLLMDLTYILVSAPAGNHTDYYNRKGLYSNVIQAVVDHNYIFRDIYIGGLEVFTMPMFLRTLPYIRKQL